MFPQGGAEPGVFNAWTRFKIQLNAKDTASVYFYEREIWWTALGKNIGSEIDGKNTRFERPVLILKKYSRDSCFILPFTTQLKPGSPYQFQLDFTERQMAVVLTQGRTISPKRFVGRLGLLPQPLFTEIVQNFKKQF